MRDLTVTGVQTCALPISGDSIVRDDAPAPFFGARWNPLWGVRIISLGELLSGGPPRDGIPSIDVPKFVSTTEADAFLGPRAPVIHVEVDGDVRAYPIEILIWHEIANDVVGGVPVAVTFCPLCNTAIAYDRRIDGE